MKTFNSSNSSFIDSKVESIVYQAVNSITTVANSENIIIDNGADVTFKAGNYIHFKPGSNINSFGILSGSKTHAYIMNVSSCTTPFRRGNVETTSNLDAGDDPKINMIISPNPFTNVFDVIYSVFNDSKITVEIFDSYGRKLISIVNDQYTESGNYSVTVNMQSFKSGIYYIKMLSENKSYSKKLIKL